MCDAQSDGAGRLRQRLGSMRRPVLFWHASGVAPSAAAAIALDQERRRRRGSRGRITYSGHAGTATALLDER